MFLIVNGVFIYVKTGISLFLLTCWAFTYSEIFHIDFSSQMHAFNESAKTSICLVMPYSNFIIKACFFF